MPETLSISLRFGMAPGSRATRRMVGLGALVVPKSASRKFRSRMCDGTDTSETPVTPATSIQRCHCGFGAIRQYGSRPPGLGSLENRMLKIDAQRNEGTA